jgi:uncharacterized protein (TIGR03083 family)
VFGPNLSLDPREVAAALTRAGPWLDANLRHVSQPSAQVRSLTWTVGDVAAHVAAVLEDYRSFAEGGAPYGVTAPECQRVIDAGLARVSERQPLMLADRIRDNIESLAAVVASSRPRQTVNWYLGTTATPAFLGAIVLGELLVHGCDIATTSNGDTTLDPIGSRFGMLAAAATCVLVLTPKGKTVTADLDFRIRGYETIRLRLDNGHAQIMTQPTGRPDVWFEGAPGPFLLWMHERSGELKPFLNRSIRIGGRRPWRAFAVAKWIETV